MRKVFSLVFIPILVIILVSLGTGQELLRVYIDNMYSDWFKDGLERCFIVMYNGTRFEFTSFEEKKIRGTIGQIEDLLEENGYTWKDAMLMIHNHFFSPRFSMQDFKTYRDIKKRGFGGVFLVYVTSSGRVLTMRSERR